MPSKLVLALDFNKQPDALSFIDTLDPASCALKVGSEMFTLFGADFVRNLVHKNFKIFLDLKFHDIPNTVAQACKAAADMGVWMINVHASGGQTMMNAAVKALESYGADKPILIAVTVLTSFDAEELLSVGINKPVHEQVQKLALLAKNSGLDGVVCSAHEVALIKKLCGSDFIAVTPGIRLEHNEKNDQIRTATPQYAIQCGSDYLVIGRPITRAKDPVSVINEINGIINFI